MGSEMCIRDRGRVFEITQDGEIVWEYISPFFVENLPTAGGSRFGNANAVFRAHRYAEDHPAFAGKDLDPSRHANLNRLFS